MSDFDFDFFVIGAGSGGVRASRIAASLGARVGVAEASALGGTCVNLGCVPKKLFVYASRFPESFRNAQGFGWTVGDSNFDWPTLVERKNAEITRLNGIYERIMTKVGVQIIHGRAHLRDAHTIEISTADGPKVVRAEHILIATGGSPWIPDIPGAAELGMVSDDLFFLPQLPERMVIVGGGYIAVEFAAIFHGLGVNVTQLARSARLLRGFDTDVTDFLAGQMRQSGIDLQLDRCPIAVKEGKNGTRILHFPDGSELETDAVVFATGRRPKTANIGLEVAGVQTQKNGAIVVDDDFRASTPNIYAVGDVIDRVTLTPVALAEGMLVAHALFGNNDRTVDYTNIPTAIFSQPPIGTVGLSEADARTQYGDVRVYTSTFRPMMHTLADNPGKIFMKLIVDSVSDRVLGAHMVGDDAPEIVQGLGIALKCGATKAQFDATIGIHPTAAEEFVTMRTPRE